jgi:elongation factor P
MILATQIRLGMFILHEKHPYKVVYFQHTVTGRGSAKIPVKLRSLLDQSTAEVRYTSADKVEQVFPTEVEMEYLYKDGDDYVFMHSKNYEQYHIPGEEIADVVGYLLPNTACKVQMYDNRPIGVKLPVTVQLKVVETEPMIKGATASGNVGKPATLESGLVIKVPMFVSIGDTVNVSTVSGEYEGRPRD